MEARPGSRPRPSAKEEVNQTGIPSKEGQLRNQLLPVSKGEVNRIPATEAQPGSRPRPSAKEEVNQTRPTSTAGGQAAPRLSDAKGVVQAENRIRWPAKEE
jgi:hypothetical protein